MTDRPTVLDPAPAPRSPSAIAWARFGALSFEQYRADVLAREAARTTKQRFCCFPRAAADTASEAA